MSKVKRTNPIIKQFTHRTEIESATKKVIEEVIHHYDESNSFCVEFKVCASEDFKLKEYNHINALLLESIPAKIDYSLELIEDNTLHEKVIISVECHNSIDLIY